MTIEAIRDRLRSDDYEFLRDIELNKGNQIILLGLGGSYAYGTETPSSDLDIRGIACHSASEILLEHGFEQYDDKPTDTVIFSLPKALKLLAGCNPNVIELLGLEPWQYLQMNEAGEMLIANRDMFLSKRCIKTFDGYARMQLFKLRSYIDGSAVRSEEDVLQSVGKRNRAAINHGKLFKHAMHLFRLLLMGCDLLETGEVITCRRGDAEFLRKIRNGEILFDEDGLPNKDFWDYRDSLLNRFKQAEAKTSLPDGPDWERINAYMKSVNLSVL